MKTLEHSQPTLFDGMELESMSSSEGFHAKTSASQEKAQVWRENALAYGENTPDLLANYDPDTSSWKTSQHCLVEGLETFSETWPRSGMMRSGTAYRLPPLVRLTDATEYGLLLPTPRKEGHDAMGKDASKSLLVSAKAWPTPRANDGQKRGAIANDPRNGLPAAAMYWPTPTRVTDSGGAAMCKWDGAGSRAKLSQMVTPEELNGALNPTWVEWLMGYPQGWTEV
jgi:DNA (cytosine-5)-methyltransferase 1